MRIHHLNLATMCPFGRRLIEGEGTLAERARLVCHGLLIESDRGLVLVEAGLGLDDVRDPRRLGPIVPVIRPVCDAGETAARQVEELGFRREDVRHIVLTHLDLDHAGGLPDFPQAQVHVLQAEQRAALNPPTAKERMRYRQPQWAHEPKWQVYTPQGERWYGFECVRALDGLPPEILLVPLAGHSRGHAGVAVDAGDGWLLHCGDAYFFRGEMDPQQPWCTPGLRLFQRLVEVDHDRRVWNQQRLRELVRDHGADVRVVSAHDPEELRREQSGRGPAATAH